MLRLTVVGFLRPKTEILARSPDRSFGNGLLPVFFWEILFLECFAILHDVSDYEAIIFCTLK